MICNSNLWSVISSIGTFSMAIGTFLHLIYYRYVENDRIHRETVEKLIQPLIEDLETLLSEIEHLYFRLHIRGMNLQGIWTRWLNVRREYLMYKLPKSLKGEIEKFYEGGSNTNFNKIIIWLPQCDVKLDKIRSEIKKKILEKIKNETIKKQLTSDFEERIYYLIEIRGEKFEISLYELLCRNQTLDEYIGNKNVEKECFIIDNTELEELKRQDFQEIVENISKKINENPKLKEFLCCCEELKKKANELIQKLESYCNKPWWKKIIN